MVIIRGTWEIISPYIPNMIVIVILALLLLFLNFLINRVFKRLAKRIGRKYGLVMSEMTLKVVLYSLIVLLIILNIPGIDQKILQLLGVIGAGIIAFSSSTIIANAMSGLLIKVIKPYNLGEVVRIGEYFGKVADIKILHTELETHTKKLLSVPNSFVMKGAVKNFSKAPPIIHTEVKLGYDIDRLTAEQLLLDSAKKAGLTHPFVSIVDLGDYFVTYQVNGELVQRPEQFRFIESNLKKIILDEFVVAQKEIMTPKIIAHRTISKRVMPKLTPKLKKDLKKKQAKEKIIARVIGAEVFEEAEMKARKIRREIAQKIKTLQVPKKEEAAPLTGKTIVKPTMKGGIIKPGIQRIRKRVNAAATNLKPVFKKNFPVFKKNLPLLKPKFRKKINLRPLLKKKKLLLAKARKKRR